MVSTDNMKVYYLLYTTLLVLIAINGSNGQVFSFGACPATTSVTTAILDYTMLGGTWREIARSPSLERHVWTCVTYTIVEVVTDSSFSVAINGIHKLTGLGLSSTGTITVRGTAAAAMVATSSTYFTISINYGIYIKTLNFYIRGIDNATPTYLVLYACENVGIGKKEYLLLLGKDTMTGASLIAALDAAATAGFPRTALSYNFQQRCYT